MFVLTGTFLSNVFTRTYLAIDPSSMSLFIFVWCYPVVTQALAQGPPWLSVFAQEN